MPPFSQDGFLLLKLRIGGYVNQICAPHTASIVWSAADPTPDEPDFSFTIHCNKKTHVVWLSAQDVKDGHDWRIQVDEVLNSMKAD